MRERARGILRELVRNVNVKDVPKTKTNVFFQKMFEIKLFFQNKAKMFTNNSLLVKTTLEKKHLQMTDVSKTKCLVFN